MFKRLYKTLILVLSLVIILPINLLKVQASTNEIKYEERGELVFFWSNQEGVLDSVIPGDDQETYAPSSRKWNGLPSIVVTPNGRLWAVWMTGGFLEPDHLNYNVMYYSDDGGITWSDEFLIIDSKNTERPVYDPRLFYDQDGTLWFYINYGKTKGIIITNPDCDNPSEELKFSSSLLDFQAGPFAHRPTILSSKWENIWLAPAEESANVNEQRVYASSNKFLYELYSTAITSSPANKRFNESQIVELSDGKLMMVSRLDGGAGIEVAYSNDGGKSWSENKTNLGIPFIGPGSKFHIERLPSGALLFLNHKSTTSREKLTAYLSYDDGKTWPYSLVFDDRESFTGGYWGVSYPESTVDSDGNIYIIWDQRTPLVEINIAKVNENDIKNGKIVTEGNYLFKNVVRNSPYYDVISVEEEFSRDLTVKLGTEKDDIISKLPTTLTIKDEFNQTLSLTGEWKTLNYNGNEEGEYSFVFNPLTNYDEYRIDSYNLLRVKVNVINQDDSIWCNPIFIGGIIGGALILSFVFILIIIKEKRVVAADK